jgi:hypothetical protein
MKEMFLQSTILMLRHSRKHVTCMPVAVASILSAYRDARRQFGAGETIVLT